MAAVPAPMAGQDGPLAADLVEAYRLGGPNAPQWAFFEGREPTGFDAADNPYVLDARPAGGTGNSGGTTNGRSPRRRRMRPRC